MSLTTPTQSRMLATSSSFKESYVDFREVCLNFRSLKYENTGPKPETITPRQPGNNQKGAKNKFAAFGKSLKVCCILK